MSSPNINVETANVNKHIKLTTDRIEKTVESLSSGKSALNPGDELVNFNRANALGFERSRGLAQIQSVQSRLNWFRASLAYLSEIQNRLQTMSELAMQAKSGTKNSSEMTQMDAVFQESKEQISQIVDGQSGTLLPSGSFLNLPLFMGYDPNVRLGSDASLEDTGFVGLNLYTALETPGFDTLPVISNQNPNGNIVLTGTAQNTTANTTSVILDDTASSIPDIYEGKMITITDASGTQTATQRITNYNSITSTAILDNAIPFDIQGSSYSIDSGIINSTLVQQNQSEDLSFNSFIWGADNYRFDWLSQNDPAFVPLTQEERTFRDNALPPILNTDTTPRTAQEKLARRQANIFDPEFGNVKSAPNATRMVSQIDHAMNQISLLITRQDAKAENITQQGQFFQEASKFNLEGIDSFSAVNIAESSADLKELENMHQRILDVASRISSNFAKLTRLMTQR